MYIDPSVFFSHKSGKPDGIFHIYALATAAASCLAALRGVRGANPLDLPSGLRGCLSTTSRGPSCIDICVLSLLISLSGRAWAGALGGDDLNEQTIKQNNIDLR